jgi:hypothetical protein
MMTRKTSILLIGSVFLAFGCSSADSPPGSDPNAPGADDPNAGGSDFDFEAPTLTSVTPTRVALGDVVTVRGTHFLGAKRGTLWIQFSGPYTLDSGETVRTDTPPGAQLIVDDATTAHFIFGPTIFFSPSGDQLGTFKGDVALTSQLIIDARNGKTGDKLASDSQSLTMAIQPSILVRTLHSVDGDCNALVSETTAGSNLALDVRAIGLGTANGKDDPIYFKFNISSPSITATFTYDAVTPAVVQDTMQGMPGFSIAQQSGDSVAFNPKQAPVAVTADPPVQFGGMSAANVKLTRLIAGQKDDAGSMTGQIIVSATRNDGRHATRAIPVTVWGPLEIVPWDGVERKVEIEAAASATGCNGGGILGNQYTYHEGTSEMKMRSVSFNWNHSFMFSVGGSVGLMNLVGFQGSANFNATWSNTFDINISESVSSSSESGSSGTVSVIPGYVVKVYRQATKLLRSTPLIVHTTCGDAIPAGTADATNWAFAFFPAQGPMCDPPAYAPDAVGGLPQPQVCMGTETDGPCAPTLATPAK